MKAWEILLPVGIVGGLAALYYAVQRAEKITAAPSSGILVGTSPTPVNFAAGVASGTSTDSQITTGLSLTTSVVSKIPVVGQIVGPILGVFTSIAGVFTAHHSQAVAVEASTINTALPVFLQTVEQIMYELNEGLTTPSSAIAQLNAAQATYYATVASIIKKGGACRPANLAAVKQTSYTSAEISGNCYIYTEDWADCASAGDCNASCAIGCGLVEPTVAQLTKIINAGGGTFMIPPSSDNGAIQGTASVTITYTPYVAPPEIDQFLSKIGSYF
jgi:hypothetical protein